VDAWFIVSLIFGVLAVLTLLVRRKMKGLPEFPDPKPTREEFPVQVKENAYGRTSTTFDPLPAELEKWEKKKRDYTKSKETSDAGLWVLKGIASVLGSVALGCFVMSLFVIVGTNKVGIMVEAGKPTEAYSNGFHLKKPWAEKAEFDGTRQFLRFGGDGNNETDLDKKVFPKIEVKLDGQAKAWISGTIAWQMRAGTEDEKKNAVELFKTYRTFERLTTNLVNASARKAIGEVFSKHNPLDSTKNQSQSELNSMALQQLQKEFDGELIIVSVDLAVPDYDDQTDAALSAMQAQKAKTSLAQEELLTNQAKAAANKALEAAGLSPLINQANCIQVAKENHNEPGYCMMIGATPIIGPVGASNTSASK
jgi:hypothetical protein